MTWYLLYPICAIRVQNLTLVSISGTYWSFLKAYEPHYCGVGLLVMYRTDYGFFLAIWPRNLRQLYETQHNIAYDIYRCEAALAITL